MVYLLAKLFSFFGIISNVRGYRGYRMLGGMVGAGTDLFAQTCHAAERGQVLDSENIKIRGKMLADCACIDFLPC